MLTERSDLTVREGLAGDFAGAMRASGLALLASVPGVRSVGFGQGVEHPDTFMLLVGWADMAAHTAYNQTPACQTFRELIIPFLKGATMQHFEID